MIIKTFSNNLLQVNTYFLINEDKCLIIDPGSNSKKIREIIEQENLTVLGIILTHAHFDHFMSCNELNQYYNVPLYVHPSSIELLYDPRKNVSALIPYVKELILDKNILITTINEDTTNIEGFNVEVIHTPGHSPDGICLYFKEDKALFSGDTLFKLSIGRSDFYLGNEKELITNIKNKIFTLPDDITVYPGHGPKTTIIYEKEHNMYLK